MIGYIDPHVHMVSRTCEDYERMAMSGCRAVTEPAFWAGYDRVSSDAFCDYFKHLTEFEPARAGHYGIQHFCWLCLNPKEGEDRTLAQEILELIPQYLGRPNVLGIGEIGLNRVTKNELKTFLEHVDLAAVHDQLILIHTPHLEDKYKGTGHIIEALRADSRIDPGRVLIDHAEEHTVEMILEAGFWAGITLYPQTKTSPQRAIDMVECFGSERICVNSACDWGPSTPLAVPQFAMAMRRRGHRWSSVQKIILDNPKNFLQQSPNFSLNSL